MSPMHHSSTSPLQSASNIHSYINAVHSASGSRTNTLAVRPSGLQRSVSLPLSRERTPPRPNRIVVGEVAGARQGDEPVLLRTSPMKEEPDTSAVELEPSTFVYRRRGAMRTRRAYSQEVGHLSPYVRPRNQSAGAGPLVGLHTGVNETTVTLNEEEEDREEDKTSQSDEEKEDVNPLVESVKHKLLEQGHLSLLDVVEKMPTTLHESIVTDGVSRPCLETITHRVPELQAGHLALSDADSSRGAIHWFEGERGSLLHDTYIVTYSLYVYTHIYNCIQNTHMYGFTQQVCKYVVCNIMHTHTYLHAHSNVYTDSRTSPNRLPHTKQLL